MSDESGPVVRLALTPNADDYPVLAGFTAARFVTHDQFDKRPWQLTVLNVAHELVTVLVMALIIGVWPA